MLMVLSVAESRRLRACSRTSANAEEAQHVILDGRISSPTRRHLGCNVRIWCNEAAGTNMDGRMHHL